MNGTCECGWQVDGFTAPELIADKLRAHKEACWQGSDCLAQQDWAELRQRVNVLAENNKALLDRQDKLRAHVGKLEDELKATEDQNLRNMEFIDGRFAKIRDRLDKLEGVHRSR